MRPSTSPIHLGTFISTPEIDASCSDRPIQDDRRWRARTGSQHHRAVILWMAVSLCFLSLVSPGFAEGVPASERAALIALYESTGGENWQYQANWLGSPGTESDWYGVAVEEGHVVAISMEIGGMVGEIPGDLAALPYLGTLEIIGPAPLITSFPAPPNNLTLAPGLGNVASLRLLRIRSGQLATVPAEIGRLGNLETMDLGGNRLVELPNALGSLQSLRVLDLSGNRLIGLPDGLGRLSSLETLVLDSNPLASLGSWIGQLGSLRELYLANHQLQTLPPEIGQATALEVLDLRGGALESLPESFGQLSNLVEVDFSYNHLQSLPDSIGNLQKVRELPLRNNELTTVPAQIGGMASLERLLLSENHLVSLPDEIGRLDHLTDLYLQENSLTELPAGIGDLVSLRGLNADDNLLSSLPETIGDLTQLVHIRAARNRLTSLPQGIGSLERLRWLELQDNRLDTLPDEFAELTSLEILDLSGNDLTGIPPALFSLEGLTELHLASNHLDGPVPAELDRLQNLETLDLSSNRLAGPLPDQLRELSNLQTLFLEHNALRAATEKMISYLNERVSGGYADWLKTQTGRPSYVDFRVINAETIELWWVEVPQATDAIAIYYASTTAANPTLVFAEIEANRSSGIKITGLDLGADYTFAVRGLTYPNESNRNRVESEPGRLLRHSTPAVLSFVFPLVESGPQQFTGISVTNASGLPANLRFTAMGIQGEVLPLTRNPADLLVPAHAHRAALVRELFETAPSGPFWVLMTTDNTAIAPLALVGNFNLQELDGYVPMELSSQRLDFARIYEGQETLQGQPAQTTVAIVNPSPVAVSVRLSLRGPAPDQAFEEPDEELSEPRFVSIPPGGMLKGTVSQLFGETLSVPTGDCIVQSASTEGVMGAALVRFPGTLMTITGEPPFPSRDGFAPSLMIGASKDLEVFSNLKLINRAHQWDVGTLTARRADGTGLGTPAEVGLWFQRSWEGDLQSLLEIGSDDEMTLEAPSLGVHFGMGTIGNVVVGERDQLKFATAFPLQTLPFTDAVFSHLASTPEIFTGLALLSPLSSLLPPAPTTAVVDIYDQDGHTLGTKSIHLEPGRQQSSLVSELFPELGPQSIGYIRVHSDRPIVAVEIFADWALNYYAVVPPTVFEPVTIPGAARLAN